MEHPDTPVEWETFNEKTQKWFRNTDSIIEWANGRKLHLQHGVDVTKAKTIESLLQQRLQQQELMSSITDGIITSDKDADTLIGDALERVGKFFKVDRITLARFNDDDTTLTLRTGWYKKPEFHLDETFRPALGVDFLKSAFVHDKLEYLSASDVLKDPAYAFMHDAGIAGFIYAPIFLEGKLAYRLGMEMIGKPRIVMESDIFLATTLVNIISGLLANEVSQHEIAIAEEQTQLMLDVTPLACFFFDDKFRIIDCNQEAVSKFGFSGKEEILRSFFEYAPTKQPDGALSGEKISGMIREAFGSGHATFPWTHRNKNGGDIPTEVTLIRVNWEDGYRVVCYTRDLREELTAEKKLREAEERTQIMLDVTPLASYFIHKDGYLVDCNQEAVRLFKAENKNHLIKSFFQTFSPEYQYDGAKSDQKAKDLIRRAYVEGSLNFEWIHRQGDGEVFPSDVILKRVFWKDSYHVVGYIRNLRLVKKTESELKQRTRLLETVNMIANNLMHIGNDPVERIIGNALEILGQGVSLGSIKLWENVTVDGKSCYRGKIMWPAEEAVADNAAIPYDSLPYLRDKVAADETINGPVESLPPEERERLAAANVRSVLVIPLHIDNRVIGFVSFEDLKKSRAFTTQEEHVLRSGSTLIASAMLRIDSARQLERSNEDLIKKRKLLIAVNNVATIILGSEKEDFPRVIQKSLQILGESVGADKVSLWENQLAEGGELYSIRLPGWRKGQSYEDSAGPSSVLLRETVPEWFDPAKKHLDINRSMAEMNAAARKVDVLHNVESLLLIPLHMQDNFWGFVGFSHDDAGFRFSEEERNILRSGSMMIAAAVMRNQMTDDLAEAEVMAATDSLTGLLNRSSFIRQAQKLFHSSKADGKPLCVMFLDLDYFKQTNDAYGHPFGDEVLVKFAEILKQSTRPNDLCCRYGGEEFLLAIPGGDDTDGAKVGERIMHAVANTRFASNPEFRFTVSIGMDAGVPLPDHSLHYLIKKADEALYAAKRNGRNRLERYSQAEKKIDSNVAC